MSNILQLNRIALWRPKLCDELTVRECGAGRPYEDNHTIKRTSDKTYRYAKNYEKSGKQFCLFAFTYANNADVVERQLDKFAKKIKKEDIEQVLEVKEKNSFTWTDYYLEEE